ncbi:hypothetical protein LTT66_18370 [Nocardia gipuzkoensis]|uniref:hypothetical protein n=1 Tax=Nocardia gipuzkoensis TaxID=2749991 RepID=UPI001E4F6AFF|nr:hypothetical protein [Nocardia gipuzkoensis]UGT65336.1 hypothetical protein LTT66_18370 [Nocardia gipuzkoensis]
MFDPAAHTVPEVLAYLEAIDDPAEVGRVLAAERTSLARMEILSRFPDMKGGRTVP